MILLINCLVVYPASGSGSEPPLFSYVLKVDVITDSDWSKVTILGLGRVVLEDHSITVGGSVSDFYVSLDGGLTVSVGKSAYDMTPVTVSVRLIVMDPDEELRLRVTKGHIGFTEVSIGGWSPGGFDELCSLVHDGVNRDDPDENSAEFTVAVEVLEPARVEVELGRLPVDVGRQVLALHYPWYGSPDGPSRGWAHWQPPFTEDSIGSSTHYPLLGPYDSLDASLVEAQVLLAQGSGIDGFISSWWGPGSFEDQAFKKLVGVAESAGFSASVYYESTRMVDGATLSAEEMGRELGYVVNEYGGSEAYLRVGGSPVVFVYNVESIDRPPEFWDEVRGVIEEEAGSVVLVGDFRDLEYLGVFDGVHFYNELDFELARGFYEFFTENSVFYDGSSFDGALQDIVSTGRLPLSRKIICGTVLPGYDDHKIRSPSKYVGRLGGLTYGAYWSLVEDFSVDWALITSWNEWHEGTEVEPSLEHGFMYLNLTRGYSAAFKDSEPINSPVPEIIYSVTGFRPDSMELVIENRGSGPALSMSVDVFMDLGRNSSESETLLTRMASDLIFPGEIVKVPFELGFSAVEEDLDVSVSYYTLAGALRAVNVQPYSVELGDQVKYTMSYSNGTHAEPIGWMKASYLNRTSGCTLNVTSEYDFHGESWRVEDEVNLWSGETESHGVWWGLFRTDVGVGDSVRVLNSTGVIAGVEILTVGPYSADCWRLEVSSSAGSGGMTFWFDEDTGLTFRAEFEEDELNRVYSLSSTNVFDPYMEASLELEEGWNLISIPFMLHDDSVSSVLRDVDGCLVLSAEGSSFRPVDHFEVGSGYFVYVPCDLNITLRGSPVVGSGLALRAGWNMIGGPDHSVLASDVFPGFYQILTWDGEEFASVDYLEPYKGYWVLILEDTVLDMEKSKPA